MLSFFRRLSAKLISIEYDGVTIVDCGCLVGPFLSKILQDVRASI